MVPDYLDGTLVGGVCLLLLLLLLLLPAGPHRCSRRPAKQHECDVINAVNAGGACPTASPRHPPPTPTPLHPDHGFDPLGLGSSPEQLLWNTHAEIFHGRLAMAGCAGILLTSLLHAGGADVPEWYEAGRVYLDRNPNVSFAALVYTTIVLSGFVEFKRLADIRSPGSQGEGILPADFKGTGPAYPGGRYFDPMGLSRGSAAQLAEYKVKELKNGRLAMVGFLGFAAQYCATGKGPIDNLAGTPACPCLCVHLRACLAMACVQEGHDEGGLGARCMRVDVHQ